MFGIDPGTYQSAFFDFDESRLPRDCNFGKVMNRELKLALTLIPPEVVVIEKMANMGMRVGATTFDTCEWIGRFKEAAQHLEWNDIYRREVKMNLLGTTRGKDKDIRAALIARFGEPGTKKNPGPTYGITADVWSAFAICVTQLDKQNGIYPWKTKQQQKSGKPQKHYRRSTKSRI